MAGWCGAIWEFPLGRDRSRRVRSVGLLVLFKMGAQAGDVCLCCSFWCVKWNSGSWAGLGPSLYLPPNDYFIPLIFLPPPLIWEDHWKKREGRTREGKERGRESGKTIDWPSAEIQRLTAEPWVAMLPVSPLIYAWDPRYIQRALFYKSLQIKAKSFPFQTCWDIQKKKWSCTCESPLLSHCIRR